MILSIKRHTPATISLPDVHETWNSASPENLLLIAVRAMPAKIESEAELSKGDLWVFGYGSLMWRSGFAFIEHVPARPICRLRPPCSIRLAQRATPEKPVLVPGLDRAGACRGVAFRVAA